MTNLRRIFEKSRPVVAMGVAFSLLHESLRRSRLIRGVSLHDKDGKVTSWFGTRADIDQIKRTEESLSTSERKYRGLFEAAYDSILVADVAGKIVSVNRQLEEKFGYSSKELVGNSIEILIPERIREGHVRKRGSYSKNPMPRPMGAVLDLSGRRKDGSEFPVEISLSSVTLPEGNQINAIIRDISERKKIHDREAFLSAFGRTLEETLDYSERLQIVADSAVPFLADICIVSILEGGDLIFKAVASQDENRLNKVKEIGSVKARTDFQHLYTQVLETKKPVLVGDVKAEILNRRDVDQKFQERLKEFGIVSFAILPLISRGVAIGAVSFSMADPSRRFEQNDLGFLELVAARCAVSAENARLYLEAQDATRERELILSIVAHDLLNPIGVINMTGQLLVSGKTIDQDKVTRLAEGILRSTDVMRRLVSDLLDFGKIQSGTLKIERTSVPISIIMAEAMEPLIVRAKEKGLHLSVEVPDKIPNAYCDRGRFVQVLWNIIGNAIKFTPNEGTIAVDASHDSKFVQFRISDSGPGLESHELPKVFDRFWQSGKSSKSSTGLGLAISKGFVEAHGGKILVASEKGHGCIFYFTVPIALRENGIQNV